MRRLLIGLLFAAGAASGCGPPTVRPVSFPDPDISCPAGRLTWGLQIQDERVLREAQAHMISSVSDAIRKSFPGCRWGASDADAGTIAIEVHRFASKFDSGGWEAAVEWTVTARDAAGHVLTQFEVNEEVSRPNYQGSDNEKESLSEAFQRGVERTAKGLKAMSISEVFRHREGTVASAGGVGPSRTPPSTTRSIPTASLSTAPRNCGGARVERISQPV